MNHDTVSICGLELFAYHGVNPEEKEKGQRFVLDIHMDTDVSEAASTDDLTKTVNYAAALKLARSVFLADKYDLIETAASRVAEALLSGFDRISALSVTVKKPDAPMKADFDYVAVTVRRERAI